ncbi:MAG: CHAT domain-containing protein [Candidatus Promineifilaceae bacterium]
MNNPKQFLGELLVLPSLEAQKKYLQSSTSLQEDSFANAVASQLKAYVDTWYETHGVADPLINLQYALATQTKNPHHRVLALRSDASQDARIKGDFARAYSLIKEIESIIITYASLEAAKIQILGVYCLCVLERFEEAKRIFEKAKLILLKHEAWRPLIQLQMNFVKGYYTDRGDFADGLILTQEIRQYAEHLDPPDLLLVATIHNNAFKLEWALGNFEAMGVRLLDAVSVMLHTNQFYYAGLSQQTMALGHYYQGRYADALRLLYEARVTFRNANSKLNEFLVEHDISMCLLALRRFSDVLIGVERARQIDTDSPLRKGKLLLHEMAAYANLSHTHIPQAQLSLKEAHHYFVEAEASYWVALTEIEFSHLHFLQEAYEQSLEVADRSVARLTLGKQHVWLIQALTAKVRAAIHLAAWQVADDALTVAEQLCTTAEAWMRHAVFYWRGIWTKEQFPEEPRRALSFFERAISDLEHTTARMLTEYRPLFLLDKQVIYEEAIALYLRLGDVPRALEHAERAKSRALLDLLAHRLEVKIDAQAEADQTLVDQLHALQAKRSAWYRHQQIGPDTNKSSQRKQTWQRITQIEQQITTIWSELLDRNPAYTPRSALWQVTIDPIHAQLRPNELLLEYYVVHGQMVAFLLTATTVQSYQLSATSEDIESLLVAVERNFRAAPQMPDLAMRAWELHAQKLLRRLYQGLIEPIIERVSHYQHVFIVPHGILHRVPFHALYDGKRYLVEHVTLSQLPSASVLRFCRNSAEINPNLITFGHCGHPNDTQIPYAEEEAQYIAAQWDGQAFLNEAATLEQFKTSAPHASILHLAMHGQFNHITPLLSGVRLHDHDLTTLELFNLRLDAALVVVSACSTGKHALSGGDELIGLMRAFLSAGAASIVLTLWHVEDRSTLIWMQQFYAALHQKQTRSEAMQTAHRFFIKYSSSNYRYRHPYYWAPFQLIGDVGPIAL